MRVGADIGGTFTDLVLTDDRGGLRIHKLLTTPDQPDDAVIQGTTEILDGSGLQDLGPLIHGTTLFTNALIERKGSKTALITTRGFRDAVEIGREHRYDMYDLYMRRPEPLAPRRYRFEVVERILADGSIQTPLDEASLQAVLAALAEYEIEAVGVCLLHSYANPIHERRIGEALTNRLPDVAVTLSCELAPEIREYERTSTTLANVYVQRTAQDYLGRLRDRLDGAGHGGDLFVMQSNGGVCTVETAAQQPIRLVESGPAAGALAAAHCGRRIGRPNVLSFDMGGTTAKACLIIDGQPVISPDFEVDRQYQFKKGSGIPIKVPVIEMIEVGTGGGSIARIDSLGRLQVGPDSAGAVPGPVAYGRGGTLPTVTDADLVLGYLDPAFFLGGKMSLDRSAAEAAIIEHIAEPLGLSLLEAAWGIHQLANETMASAARIHAVEQGKDIASFPVFAFGGAGPVHAHGVARILRSTSVIYPQGAGVMSAVGFLTAPLSIDLIRSRPGPLETYDWAGANAAVTEMKREGTDTLSRTVSPGSIEFAVSADMRYRKQGYELRIPVPDRQFEVGLCPSIKVAFEQAYRDRYGHIVPDTPVDIVSWRVTASGPDPNFTASIQPQTGGRTDKGVRPAYLPDRRCMVDVPVFDRYSLRAGVEIKGPAIIEERESTAVIGGDGIASVDEMGNLVVDIGGLAQ